MNVYELENGATLNPENKKAIMPEDGKIGCYSFELDGEVIKSTFVKYVLTGKEATQWLETKELI